MRQQNLPISDLPKSRRDHGGKIREGKRKQARPLDPERPLHLVLASRSAKGAWSFHVRKHKKVIEALVRAHGDRYGIRIHNYVNVGNHLHLLIQTKSRRYWPARKAFQTFLRRITGDIAMKVTSARKGRPVSPGKKDRFWDQLAYSRVVTWGQEFKNLTAYLMENFYESVGLGRMDHARAWGKAGLSDVWDSMLEAGFGAPLPANSSAPID